MRPFAFRPPALLLALALGACPGLVQALSLATVRCPYCGTSRVPPGTGPSSRIAPASEPGTPLEVAGTVRGPDGRAPVAGAVIYARQPDARGDLPERPPLEGWVRTDSAGHFRFVTIRPGGVATRIDLTIAPPRGRESRLDPIALDAAAPVRTDARGVQHLAHDIVLERVP